MRSFIVACMAAVAVFAAPKEDQVTQLPDAEAFDTATYSGYLNITDTKSLHYAFAESKGDPANDPVIIWFNGGPGCSSMLGFMQENGPRIVDDGETQIKNNPYPWNQAANVMWLESPAGVGYSLAETDQDMSTNDMVQSQDAINALKVWYTKFPEFKKNKLFVSGESYAGVYVPYLAWQIYQNNLQAKFNTSLYNINLAGTMVGNGLADWSVDSMPSFPRTVFNFNTIPRRLLEAFETNDCHVYLDDIWPASKSPICVATWAEIQMQTGDLNWYDLYRKNDGPLLNQANASRMGSVVVDGKRLTYKRGMTQQEYTPWAKHLKNTKPVIVGDFVSDYMNRPDVRKAFNIPSKAPAWEMCSSTLNYNLQDEASLWIYKVLNGQIKMMFYSGDTDGAVPTYGSKQWIKKLNRPVVEAWRPWTTNGEVSGYVEKYQGLDFVTVKGVGHMAPQWARQAVTDMISAWTHDKPF